MRPTVPLLVLSLFVAGGCGGSSSGGSVSIASGPAPVTSTAGGWKAYAPSGGGYRIEIPGGWATLDAASVANSSALSELTKANPDLQGAAAGFQQLASHPGALLAIDTTAGGRISSAITSSLPTSWCGGQTSARPRRTPTCWRRR
jgi:hypothetical protein